MTTMVNGDMLKNEVLFHAIYDTIAVGIALVDFSGRPIAINPALQKILGYTEEEIKTKVFTEFTHPEDASKDWLLFQDLIRGKIANYQMEKRYLHKNGQIVYGVLNVSIINAGSAPSVIATVVNITERVHIEEELKILNKLMQAVHRFMDLEDVYNVALDTVVSMDNVDMAMIYLLDENENVAVLRAQRNVPESYVKRASAIPYPKGITWDVIRTGATVNVEDAQKDPKIGPAGRELGHHSLLGVPIFLEDKVIGAIWFLSYKERKFSENEARFLTTLGNQIALAIAKAKMIKEIGKTQEKLIQSEKLASIGQLISSIAHEINNPLTPIIGYSQILLEKNGIDSKERKSLEIIHESAQRVFKVIEKLLSFSRENLPVRRYEDINNVTEKSIEFRTYQLKLENIEIIKDLDPRIPKTMIDPNQIQQVIMNVLLNAEQAIVESHGQGSIVIKTRLKNDDYIEVSISDDGPGIPKKIMGKVFDPFFTTKQPGKGTGLGLSISYGIIKEHGGRVYIQDNEKGGATFVIDLPVQTPGITSSYPDDLPTHGELMALKNKRVLVVDDEAIVVDLLKSILDETANIVDVASNGKQAIDRIAMNLYDLIICDVRMPEIGGVKLYGEVQKTQPALARKFIFMTGDPSDETIDFLKNAANPFLIKPFKIDEFRAQISKFITNMPTHR